MGDISLFLNEAYDGLPVVDLARSFVGSTNNGRLLISHFVCSRSPEYQREFRGYVQESPEMLEAVEEARELMGERG